MGPAGGSCKGAGPFNTSLFWDSHPPREAGAGPVEVRTGHQVALAGEGYVDV